MATSRDILGGDSTSGVERLPLVCHGQRPESDLAGQFSRAEVEESWWKARTGSA